MLLLLAVGVSSCQQKTETTVAPTAAPTATPPPLTYNPNSWKSIIPDTCQTFFDGCNNCRRATDGPEAACTRKACSEYSKPRCLDSESRWGTPNTPASEQPPKPME